MSNLQKKAVKAKNPQLSEIEVGVSSPEKTEKEIKETKPTPKNNHETERLNDANKTIGIMDKQIKNLEAIISLQDNQIKDLKKIIENLEKWGKGQESGAPYYSGVSQQHLEWIEKDACVQLTRLPAPVVLEYRKRLSFKIVKGLMDDNSAIGWAKDLSEIMRGYVDSKQYRLDRKGGDEYLYSIKLLIDALEAMENMLDVHTSVKKNLFFHSYKYEIGCIEAEIKGAILRQELWPVYEDMLF